MRLQIDGAHHSREKIMVAAEGRRFVRCHFVRQPVLTSVCAVAGEATIGGPAQHACMIGKLADLVGNVKFAHHGVHQICLLGQTAENVEYAHDLLLFAVEARIPPVLCRRIDLCQTICMWFYVAFPAERPESLAVRPALFYPTGS